MFGRGGIILLLSYYNWWTANHVVAEHKWTNSLRPYNATYPLTPYVTSGETVTFRIGIVTDLDRDSKSKSKPHEYISFFKKGHLTYNKVKKSVTVKWDEGPANVLKSTYSQNGRGMELSELIVYDGRLLTFDDRSGMIFEIVNSMVAPWVVLADGNGHMEKGCKVEWAVVKDEILYVGSMGKEWTTASGSFESYDPMYVKAVNIRGEVQHLSWINQYKAIRAIIGINWPGYMIHESAVWSQIKNTWYFLPRKCSHDSYNETVDELMGCHYLITADANFKNMHSIEITHRQPDRGFSSFKFIPGTDDEAIVALKTVERSGKTATYITAFTTDSKVLMPETLVDHKKYEGIEFI